MLVRSLAFLAGSVLADRAGFTSIAKLCHNDNTQYFNLAVLNNGVTLKVSEPLEPAEPAPRRNLFALSNTFGLAVAATNNGGSSTYHYHAC